MADLFHFFFRIIIYQEVELRIALRICSAGRMGVGIQQVHDTFIRIGLIGIFGGSNLNLLTVGVCFGVINIGLIANPLITLLIQ